MGILKAWRRRRILARQAIDAALWQRTLNALPFLDYLDAAALHRLRDLSLLFLHEKELHGAAELPLDDDIRVAIAAQACVPILNLSLDLYDDWVSVIVYPAEFKVQRQEVDEDGVVHEWEDALSGEAWPGGPVVLSWEDVQLRPSGDGAAYNVVIHEFAHKLDMRNKAVADGAPHPHGDMDLVLWRAALEQSYDHFLEAVERGEARAAPNGEILPLDEWGRPLPFDPYAAETPAEFFAVMSEAFFTDAANLALYYPELYGQFGLFYKQDPAAARQDPARTAARHGAQA